MTNSVYVINIKWYDAVSAGNLIRTDVLCTNNLITAWIKRDGIYTAPATAVSFELEVSATVGDAFWLDNSNVHTIAISKTISFTPDIRFEDGIGNSFIAPPPLVLVSATPTISNNNATTISFSTEEKDTDGMWAISSPTKLTAQRDGIYLIFLMTSFSTDLDSWRWIKINHSVDGTLAEATHLASTVTSAPTLTTNSIHSMLKDEYITAIVMHQAGGDLTTVVRMGMLYLGG